MVRPSRLMINGNYKGEFPLIPKMTKLKIECNRCGYQSEFFGVSKEEFNKNPRFCEHCRGGILHA